mgnify:FL=1
MDTTFTPRFDKHGVREQASGSEPEIKVRDMLVLKLGGDLIESGGDLKRVAGDLAKAAERQPTVVVHGGGHEIDAEMKRAGIRKQAVDGLRITDESTLEVAVSVLAGRVNTRLVAAVNAAGRPAVGLTGADAKIGLAELAPPYRTNAGHVVKLGLVGDPVATAPPKLLSQLVHAGYTPIIASIGVTRDGQLVNVNADALAAQLAVNLHATTLMVAGTTAGVLDIDQRSLPRVNDEDIERLVVTGAISAGMVAKLTSCRAARQGGVPNVRIIDGRTSIDVSAETGTIIDTATVVPQKEKAKL